MIRFFTESDYDEVYQLWKNMPGVGLRSMDDSKEGITRFIRRNPTTNFVATHNGRIVGVALGGHDGRRGYLYHVCVEESYRQKSIGRQLIQYVIESMKAEKISRLALFCLKDNNLGNEVWKSLGWTKRTDLNCYALNIIDDGVNC